METQAAYQRPLIIFVHVMKTAGSTVNRILRECSPNGQDWCHNIASDPEKFRQLAGSLDWMSGHMGRDEFESALGLVDRQIEYYTLIREPADQVMSHLNYSFERFNRPDYYQIHSKNEQIVDFDIMSIDPDNVCSIMKILLKHSDLFLNIQSRLVIGADYDKLAENELARRLKQYVWIGPSGDLPALCGQFGFAMLPPDYHRWRENESRKFISPKLLSDPRLIAFLNEHNKWDNLLWRMVCALPKAHESRKSCRPAFLGREPASDLNFSEIGYLLENPDVAAAVENGACLSGRQHFGEFGREEKRMIRTWVWPD